MAQKISPSFRNCGTCDYWGGSRTTDNLGEWVTVDSSMIKGKCYNQSSGLQNSPGQQANATCVKWRKWSALR